MELSWTEFEKIEMRNNLEVSDFPEAKKACLPTHY
jgi:hypothetical protein